jgi:serine/threonine protein kinase/tetratricopeptide (TPR) repeat protein
MPLATGTRLGNYEIVAPLGAGGMGEVYRARDTRLGREVALKLLPAEVSSDAERLARFEREARTVAGLTHPNIVVLYTMEHEDGARFITMELVEGVSLDREVTAEGLPATRVVEMGIALADALTAAHERGVIHRDLKPANVMLGRDGRVKVLDFGLAKLAGTPADPSLSRAATMPSPVSALGSVLGTVPYMAPEQIRGEPVDARTDLFALGIVLYELAAGRRPFAGATAADTTSAILRDAPAPLARVRADLPGDLERIVSRCLEKNPRERFQTALDVANELRALRKQLASSAAGPSARPVVDRLASIAVLPFLNRSASADDEYFSDGLADELLNVLSKIKGLRVIARSSAFTFKGKPASAGEIGRALEVATLLEGSVRKAGSRVRISVQLVNVADSSHLWSETYDRTLDDIFAVQDDIAQSVVKELRALLLGHDVDAKASGEARAEVAAAAVGRGGNPEAHRLFLQGRYLYSRIGRADLTAGIEMLTRAVELDPNHALAWATLGQAYPWAAGTGLMSPTEGMTRGREAAERALVIEPNLAEGHTALGLVRHWYAHDWTGAEASFARALELAPGSADALQAAGMLEYCLGRYDQALALMRRAIDADPLSMIGPTYVARILFSAGRLAEAEAEVRRTLARSTTSTRERALLALLLVAQGRVDEARVEADAESAGWARLWSLAIVDWVAGRKVESDAALARLEQEHGDTSAFQVAQVRAVRGESDAAFAWLERALEAHDAGIGLIGVSVHLSSLHGDPRWTALLRRIGLEPSAPGG